MNDPTGIKAVAKMLAQDEQFTDNKPKRDVELMRQEWHHCREVLMESDGSILIINNWENPKSIERFTP